MGCKQNIFSLDFSESYRDTPLTFHWQARVSWSPWTDCWYDWLSPITVHLWGQDSITEEKGGMAAWWHPIS